MRATQARGSQRAIPRAQKHTQTTAADTHTSSKAHRGKRQHDDEEACETAQATTHETKRAPSTTSQSAAVAQQPSELYNALARNVRTEFERMLGDYQASAAAARKNSQVLLHSAAAELFGGAQATMEQERNSEVDAVVSVIKERKQRERAFRREREDRAAAMLDAVSRRVAEHRRALNCISFDIEEKLA
jgi:hypothetical protein